MAKQLITHSFNYTVYSISSKKSKPLFFSSLNNIQTNISYQMADLHEVDVDDDEGEEEVCRRVEEDITPFVGMVFEYLEEGVKFYKTYALACGFGVRRYTRKRWRDGTVKSQLIVCNRQGTTCSKAKGKSNDIGDNAETALSLVLVDPEAKRKTKVKRVGCYARIRLFVKNGIVRIDTFHEGHNHDLISVNDREFNKLARKLSAYHKRVIVANSRINIGATRTYRMCKEQANGSENVGAALNDFKNFQRDLKCFIHKRDGQVFVDFLKIKSETQEGFYYDHEVDGDGSLRRVIWVDAAAKKNYGVFGDAVSFDPTYGTNKYSLIFTPFTGVDNHKRSVTFCGALIAKEDLDSFNWVFKRFLFAMGEKEPEFIITDQDPGIISSVSNIFKKARHRFCMWHIMNKVPIKYGATKNDYPEFLKKLNAIVWDEELEPVEFDRRWAETMDYHGVGDGDWFEDVYNIRGQWVMAHCRDLKMGGVMRTTQRSESENSFFKKFQNNHGTLVEFWMRFESAMDQQRYSQKKLDHDNRHSTPKTFSHMPIEVDGSKLYTHAVFDAFQEEVKCAMTTCSVCGYKLVNEVEVTTMKDALRDREVEVYYNAAKIEASCTCRLFEWKGLLCRHVIWILSGKGIRKIPQKYVARRWTKTASYDITVGRGGETTNGVGIIGEQRIEISNLWSAFYDTVGLLLGREKSVVEDFTGLIRGFMEKLEPSREVLSKQKELEMILGCTPSQKISILPPKNSKNKGSGKRLVSNKTKAVDISNKPKRMCNNCKQLAHHDKRNCPYPFASEPPPYAVESEDDLDEEEEEEEEMSD